MRTPLVPHTPFASKMFSRKPHLHTLAHVSVYAISLQFHYSPPLPNIPKSGQLQLQRKMTRVFLCCVLVCGFVVGNFVVHSSDAAAAGAATVAVGRLRLLVKHTAFIFPSARFDDYVRVCMVCGVQQYMLMTSSSSSSTCVRVCACVSALPAVQPVFCVVRS